MNDEQKTKSPVIAVRVPEAMLERIDAFSEGRCVVRAEAVRRLIEAGLDRRRRVRNFEGMADPLRTKSCPLYPPSGH